MNLLKNKLLSLIAFGLLIGGVLTALFLGQMSWRPMHDCQDIGSTAKTSGCAILEYGYPKRWLTPDVNVGEQNVVFATVDFNVKSLIYDWFIWSTVSFAVLCVLVVMFSPSSSSKPKSKKK